MYTRCLHCHAALGANEDVEHFAVGRRLAFDAARGRLWVVCPRCYRWNLTPLEERWEAIETCERLFRGTPQRYSTDNVGFARLRSGLDLVRVGRPQRPEFAAWRYGDRFGRRRRRFLVQSGVASAVSSIGGMVGWVGVMVSPPAATAMVIAGSMALGVLGTLRKNRRLAQVVARVTDADGAPVDVRRSDLSAIDLAAERDRWALDLTRGREHIRLVDSAALKVGALALAAQNFEGGTDVQVRVAVRKLEFLRGPDGIRSMAIEKGGLANLDDIQRIAVEMALHEDWERRALEGELAELERAWREAEELAAIADNLLVPDNIGAWIAKAREPQSH